MKLRAVFRPEVVPRAVYERVVGTLDRKSHTQEDRPIHTQAHFVAVIESTLIVLVLASSVPTTVTCCPANFSGVRWSLNR